MPKYALIRNNIVFNVILAENDVEFLEHLRTFHQADEIVEADDNCEIDGSYTNGVFTRKPIPEPIVEE